VPERNAEIIVRDFIIRIKVEGLAGSRRCIVLGVWARDGLFLHSFTAGGTPMDRGRLPALRPPFYFCAAHSPWRFPCGFKNPMGL